MERSTVSKMRSQLEFLEKEGHGNDFVCVGEYYIGETFKSNDDTKGLWNEIYFDSIHYSDIDLSPEQKEYVDQKTKEYIDNLSDEDKEFFKSVKFPTQEDIKKEQVEKYIQYLDKKKAEGILSDEEYKKMLKTIH
jgi:hypothetical protein